MYNVSFRMAFNASVLVEAESEEDAVAAVYTNSFEDASVDFSYGEPVEGSVDVYDEAEIDEDFNPADNGNQGS